MNSPNKLLCFFNFPSHYRENIYLKIEEELKCDFVFGIPKKKSIIPIDKKKFRNPYKVLRTVKLLGPINFIKGGIWYCFKNFDKFILTGEYYCLTVWWVLMINKLLNKKTYLWTHGWYGNENYIKKIIKKLFFNLSDGVFLYGNYAKELMLKEGFKEDKLHVIFNSLDYDKQLSYRIKLKKDNIYKEYFKNENPVIIFIGRLTKVKKLNQLIEAQNKLNDSLKFNIIFVGTGEEQTSLKKLTDSLGLQNKCWFYGSCYDEKIISNLIFNADLCVSPGNIGLTAMHSLMYGTPIVTHDNFSNQMPEFEAIQEGLTGFFFKENDINSLSNVITFALQKRISGGLNANQCYEVMDLFYNPSYQMSIFKKHLSS